MQRIENQDIDDANIAHGVLSWIVYANRPLNIREVQHALVIEPELTYVGDDVLIDEDLLISVCLGLVTVDRDSRIIRLIHHTTQEYFERKGSDYFPHAQKNITMTYLSYLSHYTPSGTSHFCFDRGLRNLEERLMEYAFLQHAAREGGLVVRGSVGNNLLGLPSDLFYVVSGMCLRQPGTTFIYVSSSMAISISLTFSWPYLSICRSRR